MPVYSKVNKKVWAFKGFREGDRYQFKDGCFLLWQADLVSIGSLLGLTIGNQGMTAYLQQVCEQIGAVLLTPQQAKAEQDGKTNIVLPTALDARFVMAVQSAVADSVTDNAEDIPSVEDASLGQNETTKEKESTEEDDSEAKKAAEDAEYVEPNEEEGES
jgi:hypothetical protein